VGEQPQWTECLDVPVSKLRYPSTSRKPMRFRPRYSFRRSIPKRLFVPLPDSRAPGSLSAWTKYITALRRAGSFSYGPSITTVHCSRSSVKPPALPSQSIGGIAHFSAPDDGARGFFARLHGAGHADEDIVNCFPDRPALPTAPAATFFAWTWDPAAGWTAASAASATRRHGSRSVPRRAVLVGQGPDYWAIPVSRRSIHTNPGHGYSGTATYQFPTLM